MSYNHHVTLEIRPAGLPAVYFVTEVCNGRRYSMRAPGASVGVGVFDEWAVRRLTSSYVGIGRVAVIARYY